MNVSLLSVCLASHLLSHFVSLSANVVIAEGPKRITTTPTIQPKGEQAMDDLTHGHQAALHIP